MDGFGVGEVVVDANVLIHSRGQFPFQRAFIPSSVYSEVRSEVSRLKIEKLDLSVVEPADTALGEVREKSEEICSPTSEQDEDALALAVERDIPLVTDDKALQNLALHLEADFRSFNTESVSERRRWKKVCGNCGRDVSSSPCPHCGARSLRRKRVQSS